MQEWIDRYLEGPGLLRKAIAGMTPEQLRARPIAGKWSTMEVVSHLSDFEPILANRMKRILAMDEAVLLGADHDRFAERLGYQDRDVEEELRVVESIRASMGRILKAQPPEAFQRVGVHNERGPLTLEQLLTITVNHIPHHLKFVAEKRAALGLPAA